MRMDVDTAEAVNILLEGMQFTVRINSRKYNYIESRPRYTSTFFPLRFLRSLHHSIPENIMYSNIRKMFFHLPVQRVSVISAKFVSSPRC